MALNCEIRDAEGRGVLTSIGPSRGAQNKEAVVEFIKKLHLVTKAEVLVKITGLRD